MNGIDTETVSETWELTLPEDEAACQAKTETCPRAATWAAVARPCGHQVGQLCEPHKERQESKTNAEIIRFDISCGVCSQSLSRVTWGRI